MHRAAAWVRAGSAKANEWRQNQQPASLPELPAQIQGTAGSSYDPKNTPKVPTALIQVQKSALSEALEMLFGALEMLSGALGGAAGGWEMLWEAWGEGAEAWEVPDEAWKLLFIGIEK